MSRRTYILILGGCALLVIALLGSAWWASRSVPEFYAEALTLPGTVEEQRNESDQLIRRSMKLADDIQFADEWAEQFTETQINSWLVHELPLKFAHVLPPSVSDPRIRISTTAVDLGFRYESSDWSGIVSVTFEPAVAEDHRLAFEIIAVRAGKLPIPVDMIIAEVAENMNLDGVEFEWARSAAGRDQLLIELPAEGDQPAVLEVLELDEKLVRIAGRRETPAGQPVSLPES